MRKLLAFLLAASCVLPTTAQAHTASMPTAMARTSCAEDPGQLTFRQMIAKHRTGERGYHNMFLGKVVRIKDVGGKPKGNTIAKLAVAEHPVGFAPLVARVHYYRRQPQEGVIPGEFRFERRGFYVVIADRRHDGSFDVQQLCGDTTSVSRERFYSLARFARRH
ncbi:MAG: hypothetical protein ABI586_02170 [Candidatus Nanopelagicales bacterium]